MRWNRLQENEGGRAEVNLTPLIDISLVLVVILLLATPLACMLWLTFIFGATSGLLAIGQWKPMMKVVLQGATFAPEWMGGFGRFVEPVEQFVDAGKHP